MIKLIMDILLSFTLSVCSIIILNEAEGRGDRIIYSDPYASVPDIISSDGYPVEKHRVLTKDGYILEMHRIPDSRRITRSTKEKKAVLLVHGLVGSSADFVIMGPKKSLAYKLADSGYDVWLGNLRGTTYSSHQHYKRTDPKFWNFSFQQHGKYDVPASIDKVRSTTGQDRILYIGYSMGATSFFTMMSEAPENGGKLVGFIGLAPAVFMDNLRLLLTDDTLQITQKLHNTGMHYISLYPWMRDIFKTVCSNRNAGNICVKLIHSVVGEDMEQLDWDIISVAVARVEPAAVRQLEHFAKVAIAGNFVPWGRGMDDMTMQPYILSRIEMPIHLYFGPNDKLTVKSQVMRLARALNLSDSTVHPVPWAKFNHLDFIYSRQVDKLLNNELVDRVNDMFATGDNYYNTSFT